MARTRVKLNSAGVQEVMRSPGVQAHLASLGERVASAMESGAPVESGDLAASHSVDVEVHPARAVAHIGSDLDYALPIALATGYMARALDAAGGG